eukprot:7481398-Lingulodinium_polyedra.AAC.1
MPCRRAFRRGWQAAGRSASRAARRMPWMRRPCAAERRSRPRLTECRGSPRRRPRRAGLSRVKKERTCVRACVRAYVRAYVRTC